ncbi:MAG: hypothetical protein K0U86_04500 [Planctomycetes bacterium]|nr:hypothetical protein [Planctomycetota bacterium]
MKIITLLIVFLSGFALISCQRTNEKNAQPDSDTKTASTKAEPKVIHQGSVELLNKMELKGIRSIAIASEINSLLVSDGTIIDEQAVDLEVFSLSNLKRTASFTITDAMSGDYPWSSKSLAVDRNGFHALLYNQYIELNSLHAKTVLDIQPVIGRKNVYPEPWSISPNGESALVLIGSYWSQEESTLATFNLVNGKHLKKLATGRNIEYGCACFLDNETVVSISYDGVVTIHDLRNSTNKIFPKKITPGVIWKGTNLQLHPFDGGKKLVVTGEKEILVLDIKQQSVLFRHLCTNGNAILTNDNKLILWQNYQKMKPIKHPIRRGTVENVLFVADSQTGRIVGKYVLPTFYHMMIIDDNSENIYAAHYDELHKIKIDLSPITDSNK